MSPRSYDRYMNDDLVNIAQLARMLKVSIRWLRQETDANRIPHLAAGSDTLYAPDAVRAVLVKRAKGGNDDR